jgi:adenylosuccinate synthase
MGWGDEGKGTTVEFLCHHTTADLVVRYNGGPQAGHNVVTPEGRHHCFSQFGSGTLLGCHTHLSKYMLVEPFAMVNEANALMAKFPSLSPISKTTIDPDAVVITPYHWIVNRSRERKRGKARHGSCGFGVGEARSDSLDGLEVLYRDLFYRSAPNLLVEGLQRIQEHKISQAQRDHLDCVKELSREKPQTLAVRYTTMRLPGTWLTSTVLRRHRTVVFEGAQGVLLDEDKGLSPPHVTWTCTTFENTNRILAESPPEEKPVYLGVTRTYHTRHGAGPLSTEVHGITMPGEYNTRHPYQGKFRIGSFDWNAAFHARHLLPELDGLVVTCTDHWRELHYRGARYTTSFLIGDTLDLPICVISKGPTREDKEWRL